MKVLAVSVCWNFYHYIRNTVESCQEFFPEADILVVDNGSTEPRLVQWLEHLRQEGRVSVMLRGHNNSSRRVGSLYDGYNDAFDWALERGYDLIYLMNDDVQFLYHDPDLIPKVAAFFAAAHDASNLSIMFGKAIAPMHDRAQYVPELRAFRSLGYGVSDDGFFTSEFLRRTGFRFMDSESRHASDMRERGYQCYLWRDPVLAFVPWVATRRNGRIIGREFPPLARYYLKPLEDAAVRRLHNRPDGDYAYGDDWTRPWGWTCLSPYWFTTLTTEYFIKCLEQRVLPRFIAESGDAGLFDVLRTRHAPELGHVANRVLRDLARGLVDGLGLRRFIARTKGQ
jgi:glycosyltransferase involved in cell wall biosynthesis